MIHLPPSGVYVTKQSSCTQELNVIPIMENIKNRSLNSVTAFTTHGLKLGEKPPALFNGIPPGIRLTPKEQVEAAKLAIERQKRRAEKRKLKKKRHTRKWNTAIVDKKSKIPGPPDLTYFLMDKICTIGILILKNIMFLHRWEDFS